MLFTKISTAKLNVNVHSIKYDVKTFLRQIAVCFTMGFFVIIKKTIVHFPATEMLNLIGNFTVIKTCVNSHIMNSV